jgi:RsiW-degrading membrane proteinase PrsW (M82 family)
MNMVGHLKIVFSFLPVFALLLALLFLDSYKLVKFSPIVVAILTGGIMAGICFLINRWLLLQLLLDSSLLQRYLAPVIEECLKAIFIIYLIKSKKIGFIVDAAIFGFAIGAGFAAVENIYYLYSLIDANLFVWFIRGFGTAIMHGGTTAIMAIISRSFCDRYGSQKIVLFLPGLGLAIVIHSVFNHFILPPVFSTLVILVTLPLLMVLSFSRSERSLQKWLNVGFDSDVEILEMIRSGKVLKSRLGQYLYSLKNRVPGAILADMLCYLRVFVELSIKAKGLLIMREAGFKVKADLETRDKFKELKFLEKSIGKMGKLVMLPFLHTSSRDLWQLHMLEDHIPKRIQ